MKIETSGKEHRVPVSGNGLQSQNEPCMWLGQTVDNLTNKKNVDQFFKHFDIPVAKQVAYELLVTPHGPGRPQTIVRALHTF